MRRAPGLVSLHQAGCVSRRGAAMEGSERRELLVSKGWVQAVALVLLFGFFVMGLLAYRTYAAKPPIPQRVVDPAGAVRLHGRRCAGRPGGVPAQRADGVRLGLRARRLPGPGLHRRLPAPRVGPRALRVRRTALGRRGSPHGRGLPHQPLRRADRHAHADRGAGRRASPARPATTAASSPSRRRSTACGPTRSRIAPSSRS